MTEVHRRIWSYEALWNLEVYLKQKEDPSYDPGPYVPYDGSGHDGEPPVADLGASNLGGARDESDLQDKEEDCR